MKLIFIRLLLLLVPLLGFNCTSRKCQSFFTYKSTKIDIKGITTKLLKNGVETKEKSIASILIDPKFIEVSEELQRLDLYQKTLCEQLNLIKGDSLKSIRRSEYVSTLIRMMRIAQKPDSLLASRVGKLESAEEKRKYREEYLNKLKITPPNIDIKLLIQPNGEIEYAINFLNNVPIKIKRIALKRYDDKPMTSKSIVLDYGEIYPNRVWVGSTDKTIYDSELPEGNVFKVKIYINYSSIYINEVHALGLEKFLTKVYSIDRDKLTCTELKE